MKHIIEKCWITGSGQQIDFYEILKILKYNTLKGSRIFIGTDSFVSNNKICFASAVCLYGTGGPSRYFFFKEKVKKRPFNVLVTRITEEVRRSVELAEYIMETNDIESENIELHIDVSPFNMNNGTSRFSDMLRGYVTGAGFECRVKPNAWASQTVADKHSK